MCTNYWIFLLSTSNTVNTLIRFWQANCELTNHKKAYNTWETKNHKLITVAGCLKLRPRVAQWWEHSPPINVARVQILASTPYVGWVCCWFSPLFQEVFPWVFRISPPLKTKHFQIPIDQESGWWRTTNSGCATSKIVIYLVSWLVSFPSTDRPFPCLQRQSDIQVSKNLPEIADSSPEPRRAVLLGIPVQ